MSNINITHPPGVTFTFFEQGSPEDPAVIAENLATERDAAIAERDAKDAALVAMTTERDALQLRITEALTEADEAATEFQDVRAKLLGQ